MKINVTAKPASKKAYIKMVGEKEYVVSVKEPPINGLANMSIIGSLSDYFKIPARYIRIVSGYRSRNKIIEINDNYMSHI
ncbi:DUF167 domain-containing protein [Patescibacteria group bacterium]|nr:DUF167 domain-containing protein [Patescibacteria group bacterium]MBU0777117.1 DUF167 domain-containing protein [Patescibacteria group bacterium]MBU0845811.1 DUF167 domain-containing protein [Patescibacteria group bacterium]MBU0922838.1 DUF167 domain-containing protein [Patescibacteria group bacterium]MBU1066429.1 DUF167 domain-containing protein [Patescibacteria group bacterium]